TLEYHLLGGRVRGFGVAQNQRVVIGQRHFQNDGGAIRQLETDVVVVNDLILRLRQTAVCLPVIDQVATITGEGVEDLVIHALPGAGQDGGERGPLGVFRA